MQASQVSQFVSFYGAILLVCLPLHQVENFIGNRGDGEEMLLSQFPDGLFADDISWLLRLGWKAEKQGEGKA